MEFLFEGPFTDKKLLINTLMEQVKPIVMEKWNFKYRDMSKLLSFFGYFGLWELRRKDKIHHFSIEKFS